MSAGKAASVVSPRIKYPGGSVRHQILRIDFCSTPQLEDSYYLRFCLVPE